MLTRKIVRNFSRRGSNFMNPNEVSSSYFEALYSAWLRNPKSVHRSWDMYFRNFPMFYDDEIEQNTSFLKIRKPARDERTPIEKIIDDHADVYELIRRYQTKGHTVACLDPLETNSNDYRAKELHDELKFLSQDWEREFRLPTTALTAVQGNVRKMVLKDIIRHLENVYCGGIGIEYMFMDSTEHRNFIRDRFEQKNALHLEPKERLQILTSLSRAICFENFLTSNFTDHRNFSLKGCETLIPALKTIIDCSSCMGVKSFVMGLPQRGRLNILVNVCKKSIKEVLTLFNESKGIFNDDDDLGDFKYTLGTIVERLNCKKSQEMRITVIANSMHTQAFVPIVLGRARAEQDQCINKNDRFEVMPIIVHDDAGLYAQGIGYEAAQLSALPNYETQGAIHIVMNTSNTQYPASVFAKSNTPNTLANQYCRNISKVLDSPIFHVNADDPEAAMCVCKIAAEFRVKFFKDVIIQLIGYRCPEEKNCEIVADPSTCCKIQKHKECLEKYKSKLIAENIISADDAKAEINNFEEVIGSALDLARYEGFTDIQWRDTQWKKASESSFKQIRSTGVKKKVLLEVGNNFLSPPKNARDFVLNKTLHRILLERLEMLDKGMADWTLAEALAFGTLVKQGIPVRLSVQAAERDTYARRHHLLHHQLIPGKTYNILEDVDANQAPYVISYNTISENAVLGFEHGYSIANPNALVVWEARSGDLASCAQSIIDQYIATGESKWSQQSGLVMLLPHGMEGAGPENSSARIERFLQMCSDDPQENSNTQNDLEYQIRNINWIVANCTTPANYFHILRRQVALTFRKPLVLMPPKFLLEHGQIKSPLYYMAEGSEFQPIICEENPDDYNPFDCSRLIFCSGRIYFDLVKARTKYNMKETIRIVRIEQLAPFPYDLVRSQIECFENADIVWVQEEHKNQGPWSYVQQRVQAIISDARDINYIGRSSSELAASKSKSQYIKEFEDIMLESMNTNAGKLYW